MNKYLYATFSAPFLPKAPSMPFNQNCIHTIHCHGCGSLSQIAESLPSSWDSEFSPYSPLNNGMIEVCSNPHRWAVGRTKDLILTLIGHLRLVVPRAPVFNSQTSKSSANLKRLQLSRPALLMDWRIILPIKDADYTLWMVAELENMHTTFCKLNAC